jgi:CheY-like chemotaxis protein
MNSDPQQKNGDQTPVNGQLAPPELLLIEDNEDDRRLFVRAAHDSRLNATITYATNAAQAVMRLNRLGEYSATALPALIVLDLGLPGLNGKILLQVIRNAYGPRTVPVVVFTNSVNERDRHECEALGICRYVIKPTHYSDLLRFVSDLSRYVPDGATSQSLAAITGKDQR